MAYLDKVLKVARPARRCSLKQPRLADPRNKRHRKKERRGENVQREGDTDGNPPDQNIDDQSQDSRPPEGMRRRPKRIDRNLRRTEGKAIAAYLRPILLAALVARTTACDEGTEEYDGGLQGTSYNLLNCRQHPQL